MAPPFLPLPSPYSTPNYYVPGLAEVMAPARRAGLLQMILGMLCVLVAVFCGAFIIGAPLEQYVQSGEVAIPTEFSQMPTSQFLDLLRETMLTFSVGAGAVGMALLLLGWLVRRGKKGAIVGSMILCATGLLPFVIAIMGLAAQLANSPAAVSPPAVGFVFVGAGMFVWLAAWLTAAMRSRPWTQNPTPCAWAYLGDPMQGPPSGMQAPPGGFGYGTPPAKPPRLPPQ